jgi:glutathione S-transferase
MAHVALVDLVILLALVEFFVFLFQVGKARETYQVHAPATAGNEVFERYFRAQMNTLEQLVIFIPAMLLFARYVNPLIAAALGLVFVVGRWLYFTGYVKDPKQRSTGFMMSFIPNAILVLGALAGVVRVLIRTGIN